jgi:hypothetical protein
VMKKMLTCSHSKVKSEKFSRSTKMFSCLWRRDFCTSFFLMSVSLFDGQFQCFFSFSLFRFIVLLMLLREK